MIRFYLKARKNNLDISILRAIFMTMRRTASIKLLDNYMIWQKYENNLTMDDMEAYFLAGVEIEEISNALKFCASKNIKVNIRDLAAISLSGQNILLIIKRSINAQTIYLNIKAENLSISIQSEFKSKIGVLNINNEKIEKEIYERIRGFISKNIDIEPKRLETLINEEIINSKYWLKELYSELINQKVQIKNWP